MLGSNTRFIDHWRICWGWDASGSSPASASEGWRLSPCSAYSFVVAVGIRDGLESILPVSGTRWASDVVLFLRSSWPAASSGKTTASFLGHLSLWIRSWSDRWVCCCWGVVWFQWVGAVVLVWVFYLRETFPFLARAQAPALGHTNFIFSLRVLCLFIWFASTNWPYAGLVIIYL